MRVASNIVVTSPSDEPISVADVKCNAYIIGDEDDGLIRTQLIPEARRWVEQLAVRSMLTQTRRQYYDCMPDEFWLRFGPVQSVTSINYVDTAGANQVVPTDTYIVDTTRMPTRIELAYGKTWPVARDQVNSVNVLYVAGYGSTVGKVPIIYRRAMIVLATYWYQHRESIGCADGDILSKIEHILAIEGRTVEYA